MERGRYNIPQSAEHRHRLRRAIKEFIARGEYVPPLSLQRLRALAIELLAEQGEESSLAEWTMVELHNRVWIDVVASIPYERRILLLPQCLSRKSHCQAEIDEMGLLCHRCGACHIPSLEDKAAELGVMSIVAEGFTAVINLIQNGVVDAVIGVSCLDSLEKAFPLLVNNAVAGIAIPLNVAGCQDTEVDNDYVMELLEANGTERPTLDYKFVKSQIEEWFKPESLERHLSPKMELSSRAAIEWLGGEGKRLRPYLFAATLSALSQKREFSTEQQRVAIAIECFHKASLIHDDIEDNDAVRYGKPSVACLYGNDMAINIGDLLLGEGYRLLAMSGRAELISVISEAHISLCKGQGMELEWNGDRCKITMDRALEIFKLKTAPAFEVSLLLGVLCAEGDKSLFEPLKAYSEALGIAYQLRDDIEDFDSEQALELRPSAIFTHICEKSQDEALIKQLISSQDIKPVLQSEEYRPLLSEAIERVEAMVAEYCQKALDALEDIKSIELKRFLYRVTGKIVK